MLAISWKIALGFLVLHILFLWSRCLCGKNFRWLGQFFQKLRGKNLRRKSKILKSESTYLNIPYEKCENIGINFQSLYVINANYFETTHKISWSNHKNNRIYGLKHINKGYAIYEVTKFAVL